MKGKERKGEDDIRQMWERYNLVIEMREGEDTNMLELYICNKMDTVQEMPSLY